MTTIQKIRIALFTSAVALSSLPAVHAQTLTFDVDITTASLSADSANAPFYLDLDMMYGNSSLASNTATLSNFSFTGGSAVGSATTSGGASGSLGGTVTLGVSSTQTAAELFQAFSPGTTNISFVATITEKGPDIGTPSEFTASILDSSLGFPAQLFTTAPDTESLVTLNLNSANTVANVNAYTSISSADGNTPVTGVTASVVAVPEPSISAAILGCAAMMIALCVRQSAKRQMI
jgi:hypothetical protein